MVRRTVYGWRCRSFEINWELSILVVSNQDPAYARYIFFFLAQIRSFASEVGFRFRVFRYWSMDKRILSLSIIVLHRVELAYHMSSIQNTSANAIQFPPNGHNVAVL